MTVQKRKRGHIPPLHDDQLKIPQDQHIQSECGCFWNEDLPRYKEKFSVRSMCEQSASLTHASFLAPSQYCDQTAEYMEQ